MDGHGAGKWQWHSSWTNPGLQPTLNSQMPRVATLAEGMFLDPQNVFLGVRRRCIREPEVESISISVFFK